MLGTAANVVAIFAGGAMGWVTGALLPERLRKTLVAAMGLVVAVMGIDMALRWENVALQVIFAVVVGGALGEWLDIERRLNRWGEKLQEVLGGRIQGDVGRGFVYATLVYCVGPMAILGSLEGGLHGNHDILFAKAAIDGIMAMAFAATLGPGVLLSGCSVLLYQGLLTIGARYASAAVALAGAQLTSTGGLLILGLGIKILELKDIRVANLLPALPVAAALAWLM
ncbi:MAG TPA: DUF554 domain-containing protein [Bacillota bacterium]|nr:DUF554 domain-containing protein [Bacillota bacterium]